MIWGDGPLCAFDVESTGVDYENGRIVTACVAHIDGSVVTVREWLIAVDIDIPAEATAVHGITTERARRDGRPAADVIPEIAAELIDGWRADEIIVGHNVPFDFTFLDRELRRWTGSPFVVSGPVADTQVLDKAVDKWRKGSRRLVSTAAHYRVPLPEDAAHDATADALAAARIAWRMCREYQALGALSKRDLWSYQVNQAAEQAAGLQNHLRRKNNDPNLIIDPTWPIHPPAAEGTP